MTPIARIAITTLLIGVLLVFLGALAKLEHWPHSNYYIMAGLFAQATANIIGINIAITVRREKAPNITEK